MTERNSAIAFLVTGGLLLAMLGYQARRDDVGPILLARIIRAGTAPLVNSVAWVAGGVRDGWNGYVDLIGAKRESRRLRGEVERLEAERGRVADLIASNRALAELVSLHDASVFDRAIAARVVEDLSGGPLRHAVRVDRGVVDGVEAGWVATSRGAAVGRVVVATHRTADVILITDPDSGVAVRHEFDRYAGVVRGGNEGPPRLFYVPRDHGIAVGDPLVTSGLDGLYPKGLLVGHVRDLTDETPLTWGIEIEVAFDPGRLETVLLVPPEVEMPSPGEEVDR